MKKILILIGLLIVISIESQSLTRTRVTFGFFYNSLAPYGEWIEIDRNFYVWKPMRVRYDWQPYSDGRWAWTRQGWYWVSYEPFGWAVFHYGRWHYDDYYGWIWIPGYDWSPAWVEWRYDDDYIGWAPLPPYATFNIHIGITFTTHWASPVHHWSFVRYRHFCSPRVHQYYEPAERSRRFFGNTRYRTDYNYENGRIVNQGIDRELIERRTGERIRTAEIIETRDRKTERIIREGNRPRIEVYRPSEREIEQSRPERIEARRPERNISLDLDKVDRTIYREQTERQERGSDKMIDKRERQTEERETERRERRIEDRSSEQRMEKYRDEPTRSEPQKRSEKYREQQERRYEERRPEIQKEERKREAPERKREIQPERREREIEIRRERVEPRQERQEPKNQEQPREDRDRSGSGRESRNRER